MASTTRTGADRYFAHRASEPGYAEAYEEARRPVDAIDRLVRALDDRREALGLSKAELARRAELAPEAVRRPFSVDSPNPTIGCQGGRTDITSAGVPVGSISRSVASSSATG